MSPLRTLLQSRKRALLMGILNVTPDSFSDGGLFLDHKAAERRVAEMVDEGADLIDIGAESTRPGAPAVPADEQIARLGTIVRAAARRGIVVSIDTTSSIVAERAVSEGASVINSVSLAPAADLARVAERHGAALVLMHCRGSMTEMQGFSRYADAAYGDVVADVAREWSAAAELAISAGLPREELVLDPGLGFAKNARQSLELCARLDELARLGFPVLVGPSRKSFLARVAVDVGAADDPPPAERRLGATLAAVLACVERGAAIVRVHDVEPARQALAIHDAVQAIAAARTDLRALSPDCSAGRRGEVARDA